MTVQRLSRRPLVDRELKAAGFSDGAAREVKGAARDLPGVRVPAGGLQVSWTSCGGYRAKPA